MLAVAITLLSVIPAGAQPWPTRTVRMVVPFPPGGGADAMARMLAQKFSEGTGTTFMVDNRPGAGGVIGTELVARAKPDGYTLLLGATEMGTNPAVRPSLPYEPFRDFTHISQLVILQNTFASHPSVPARNVKEVIALARARPAQLTYGSSGTGGGPHLAGELFQSMAGIRWVHVPFKGAALASTAVMSGEIDFMFAAVSGLLGHVRSGRLRAIAVTGPKRSAEMPDVPTVSESGIPGYSVTGWYGLYAPAGLPQELVRRLNAEAKRALDHADAREMLKKGGLEYVVSSPEEHVGFLRSEIDKWSKVVKAAGIRLE
jgi:tripartite-type tricarboxylate transporter receptor subunit TctC